jgi:2,3-bisphosphoglycerate-dependent phosphoglycerate mutase
MKITLIRHGESEGNINRSVYFEKPDHSIALSPLGRRQATECGKALVGMDYRPQRIWVSPYARTRETATGIVEGLANGIHGITCDVKESIHLVEQQFGLFDGHAEEALSEIFPKEHAHYKKAEEFEGRFWARMPLGESRFDVCQRVHQFFGTIQRDAERHGIEDIIVVSHGVTIRAFVMMWLHKEWEWLEQEPNPANCSISVIENGSYKMSAWKPSLQIAENV